MKRFTLLVILLLACLWPLSSTSFPTHGNMGGAYFEYDVVVDLANPGALEADNACDAFATAVRPWIAGAATVNHSVLVYGTGNVTWDDFYDPDPDGAGGVYATGANDFRRCFYVGPSTSFDATGVTDHAEGDADTMTRNRLDLVFYGAELNVDMDPGAAGAGGNIQTEPTIVFMLGNEYQRGFSAALPSVEMSGAFGGPVKIHGHLEINTMDAVEPGDAGAPALPDFETDDEFPSPPYDQGTGGANDYASDTTMIGVMVNGAHRTDMSEMTFSLLGLAADTDDDDIGMVSYPNNGLQAGDHLIHDYGVGHVVYGSQNGTFWGGYISGNHFGLMFGDPVLSGDIAPTTNCTGGQACASRARDVRQIYGANELMVEANEFDFWVFDGHEISLDGFNFEHSSTGTEVGLCIGAGQDSTNDNEPCCTDADATNNCDAAGTSGGLAASIVSVEYGKQKAISDRANATHKALGLGPSCNWSTAPYLSTVDFTENMFHDTNLDVGAVVDPLFTFDAGASCYVLLNTMTWMHDATQNPNTDYDNVKFIDATSASWGANEDTGLAAGDIDGTACLSVDPNETAMSTCQNGNTDNFVQAVLFPFIGDVYIHNCTLNLTDDSNHGNILDHIDLQMQVVDQQDNDVTDLGEPFEIWDETATCGGAANCSDAIGVYRWEVRGRGTAVDADLDGGYLQVNIDNTTVDTGAGGDNTMKVNIACEVAAP